MQHEALTGRPFPLGVTLEAEGANVAVFSAHADRVELCLFDDGGERQTASLWLPEVTDQVFHGFVPGLAAGQVYGLRAHGAWAPRRGSRFNPNRLLLDPYARAVTGTFRWSGPNLVDPRDPFALDPRDNAALVPKGVMTPAGDAPAERAARHALGARRCSTRRMSRGMTMLHPAVPEPLRGTYLGSPTRRCWSISSASASPPSS